MWRHKQVHDEWREQAEMERIFTCTGVRQLAYREYQPPALGLNQVRIKAQYGAAKHGTEMSFYKGYGNERGAFDEQMGVFKRGAPTDHYPFHIGNMVVGHIVETGRSVTRFQVGDRALTYSGFSTSVVADEMACWKLPEELAWQS